MDFDLLPPEEVMLLDALEGMCGQYCFDPNAAKAEKILATYGLRLDEPDYEVNEFLRLENAVKAHKETVGYWRSDHRWIGDRRTLNERSESLLIALASVSYSSLITDGGGRHALYHVYMSSGEAACFQLAAYSLLEPCAGGGYCTEEGWTAASFARSADFPPLHVFTFEDIL